MSDLEETLAWMLKAERIPYEREFRFHPPRRWRFDFALEHKVAIEVEGGIWSGGRHTRGAGFTADCRKYNQAIIDGWKLFRVTEEMINSGEILEIVRVVMRNAL